MTRRRALITAAAFGACFLVPVFVQQDYMLQVLFRVALLAGLGVAWNIVGGYAGQLSLGNAAFYGLGAYGLALYHLRLGAPAPIALVLGMITAVVAALVIGRISFRLRGPYFALATIAFGEVLHLTVKNLHDFTGGDVGVDVPPLFDTNPSRWFYWSAVALTAAAFAITALIVRSRFGYALQAVREDEDTTMACGIDPTRVKLIAFAISAALTALAGGLEASLFHYLVPDPVLNVDLSVEIAIIAMLGGAGTLTGPIVGAVLLVPASELFKAWFGVAYPLIYGVLIVLVVLFLPEGIVGTLGTWLRQRRKPAP